MDGTSAVPWMLRRDLEISSASNDGQRWVIKDPLKLLYFGVEPEELAFLRKLDGRSTLDGIKRGLQSEFADVEFSDHNLLAFLASGIKSGILIPLGMGYGELLAQKQHSDGRAAVFRKCFSLISHRFRGIDPTPILVPLNHLLGWVYHRQVLRLCLAFVVLAAILVLSRWSQLTAELPTIEQLFTAGNIISLTCAVACIKLLHELGHALTCHHYGGECHELGCIVVGFLPLLYCDVSDSWLQRDRIRRMHVAAAGIAVELFLAAIFGLLWLASVPGMLHSFFLNVMLLCSLNTVLVNGNPLLRYDGYYVLSDLLQIPNLGPQARGKATSLIDRIVFGVPYYHDPRESLVRKIAMPIFGLASMLYRWMVLATILFVINAALRPFRLEGVSYFLAASVFAGLAFSAINLFKQRWNFMVNTTAINRRAVAGAVVTCAGLLTAMLWPLPFSVEAPFTLSPGVSSPVFVPTAGHIQPHVCYGSTVVAGELLATFRNPEIQLSQARLEGEVAVTKARVIHLTSARNSSASSAVGLPAAMAAVLNAQQRLATVSGQSARLYVHSPRSGVVRPPRNRPRAPERRIEQQFWTGQPLSAKNVETWVEEQTVLAWIGDSSELRALAYVAQRDIEFVTADTAVSVKFDSLPSEVLTGTVTRLNQTPEMQVPVELSAKGALKVDATARPQSTVFAVHVQVETGNGDQLPPLYSTGLVSIACEPRSIANRLWRLLQHTFAFDV
jgi:putative peptide zinc metalloprotease protein